MALKQRDNAIVDHPQEVAHGLQRFRRSARFLSSRRAHLVRRYPMEWVAVYESKVKAHALTLPSLLEEVERQNLPKQHVVIEFLDTTERPLIL